MEKSCCMGAAALFVYIFCTDQLGDTNGVSGFAPDRAAAFFQHRLSGGHELPQAGSPLTGGSFSAPESRGTRTALAGSPFPGGEFFAEPQRGIRRLRTAGTCRAPRRGTTPYPRRGAKRKGHLRFPFLFELLPFPCFLIWRRLPICDRFEKGNGRGFFLPCFSQPVRRVRYRSATHVIKSMQAQHDRVAQFVSALS